VQLSAVHGFPSSTIGGVPATHVPVALHVSAPLHAFPSEHDVPAATATCVTPTAGSHASVVHGFPSSTFGAAPAEHVPAALHVSAPLHAFPSEHDVPAASGVCTTPVAGEQLSAVHGFPSSTFGAAPAEHVPAALHVSAPLHALPSEHDVPAGSGVCMTPVAGEQVSAVHGFPSSTIGGVPGKHAPVALHVSAPLHTFPSEHDMPAAGMCATPDIGSQLSIVHGFPSSTTSSVPATHAPVALHVSAPLHALPSEHDAPAAITWSTPSVGSQLSIVHGFPSSTAGAGPATHAPMTLHVSAPLHAFPSEHDVPSTTVCVTPPAGVQVSAVHGSPSSTEGGAPRRQLPVASHVSTPLHASPSEHDVPASAAVCTMPPVAVQASMVHGFPSSSTGGVPG
jgi:hypothetical protein